MKKGLTQAQKDILALAVVQGAHGLNRHSLPDIARLIIADYVESGDEIHTIRATTKGVRIAVRNDLVRQDGTRFKLPRDSTLVEVRESAPATGGPVRLTVVQPPKPRDAFDEGFTDAMAGKPQNNTWTGADQGTQFSEYDMGYLEGGRYREQHPQTA